MSKSDVTPPRPPGARESDESLVEGRPSLEPTERPSIVPEERPSIQPGERISSPDPVRGKDYEELTGATGREVFFRPVRYSREDFGDIRPVIEVRFEDKVHTCELQDVSQNGVAFVWPVEPRLAAGAVLPLVVIRFVDHAGYQGAAVVSSVRELDGRCVVGASFVDSLMNIDDVLHLRDVVSWKPMTDGGLTAAGMPWHVSGFERFKSLCGEFRLFLEDTAARFGELEHRLPWHVVHGDAENPARTALLRQLQKDFVPEYLRFAYALDATMRGATREESQGLKEFSLRHIHSRLMEAPFVNRARNKPLGYPGDFELMRFLYGRRFEGTTLFAKALHFAVIHMGAGEAVRQRKEMLRLQMLSLIENAAPGQTVRIASIAAGPAREVYELLAGMERCPNPVEFILFDQDKLALGHAQSRVSSVASRLQNVRVRYRHDSIKRLLHDPTLLQAYGNFDMLFCAGLFDYLQPSTASTLCGTFYQNLAPGGRAYVGNMVDNPCRWFMEYHCEWYLIYRTREEILGFGRAAIPDAPMEILNESTGINPFLLIHKHR